MKSIEFYWNRFIQGSAKVCPRGCSATTGNYCGWCGAEMMPRPYCPHCGCALYPYEVYCSNCGRKIR